MSMSQNALEAFGSRVADGMDVPRPQLAVAVAHALRTTTVVEHVVATVATRLLADVVLCDQVSRLQDPWRVALRRAESEAMDQLGVGLTPGASHRIDIDGEHAVVLLHGDGWSLVARTRTVLVFLLDAAPGVVIDRSQAEGAAELVSGLAGLSANPR